MLVTNSPINPTGAVYDKKCLERLAAFAHKYDLFVLSDEIYEKLMYGDTQHISIASISDMRERTVVVNGLSKIYAMTGWRLGYTAAPKILSDAMILVHQYTSVCATNFAQYGGVAALNGPQDSVKKVVQEFDRRRKLVCERLQSMPGIHLIEPRGTFYVWPYVGELGVASEALAAHLLDQAKIAVVPGEAFGAFTEEFIRISYANLYENLVEAKYRMEKTIQTI